MALDSVVSGLTSLRSLPKMLACLAESVHSWILSVWLRTSLLASSDLSTLFKTSVITVSLKWLPRSSYEISLKLHYCSDEAFFIRSTPKPFDAISFAIVLLK